MAYLKLPVWLLVFIVFRAGIVEELFYRGYAIERLESLGLHRFWAVVIPLAISGVAHWTGGWVNILIALALGVILAVFYVWRHDLVANMIAHVLALYRQRSLTLFRSENGIRKPRRKWRRPGTIRVSPPALPLTGECFALRCSKNLNPQFSPLPR